MSTSIVNLQRTICVNVPLLRKHVKQVKTLMRVEKFDLNLWLRSDHAIRIMNRLDRKEDRVTDILSYSAMNLKAKEKPVWSKDNRHLGDLVFGMGYIADYCKKTNRSLDEYMVRLAVHGICHLLGYDHELDQDYVIMKNREAYIMKKWRNLLSEKVNKG